MPCSCEAYCVFTAAILDFLLTLRPTSRPNYSLYNTDGVCDVCSRKCAHKLMIDLVTIWSILCFMSINGRILFTSPIERLQAKSKLAPVHLLLGMDSRLGGPQACDSALHSKRQPNRVMDSYLVPSFSELRFRWANDSTNWSILCWQAVKHQTNKLTIVVTVYYAISRQV